MTKKIGVLALQGAFREHRQALESLGCEVIEVRKSSDLEDIKGLIIPGGESTTMGKLLQVDNLGENIKELAKKNLPIFGTCAGMIVLSKNIEGSNQYSLGLMDVTVQRNAFGRQIASFETNLLVPALGREPVRAVFIRAPYLKEVAPNVGILAEYEGKVVFARQGNLIASAFHPELTEDRRVHQYFLSIVDEQMAK
ncbi:pyridoxal 5'-phosphate synthase glutaminase subunit PdxT [Desulfitobacterium sp.]|uniref:pyridoxal 5'-phosphate synthase glutaminase subunit PdxT n=1 Tax=Desulfitobacterium sp. TaxID=49981 RepID=UPI002B21DCB4|nr:pyridoxal 5'-phosphate synthase glutaminase subunit PdxT [Desulfitobacterium sp.]MEA4900245.1 pyridoxal 5'-phosphate synthase glutaminase subunit PdxT [Desulfitobacterium sp.]